MRIFVRILVTLGLVFAHVESPAFNIINQHALVFCHKYLLLLTSWHIIFMNLIRWDKQFYHVVEFICKRC